MNWVIVKRSNIVCKPACDYCLCYCKTFLLVPVSTECIKSFLAKRAVHYLFNLKPNYIIGQSKTTNTLVVLNVQRFTANTVHLLYKLAESNLMLWKIKDRQISIFKIPKAKSGILEQKNGKENKRTSIFITYMRLCSKSAYSKL